MCKRARASVDMHDTHNRSNVAVMNSMPEACEHDEVLVLCSVGHCHGRFLLDHRCALETKAPCLQLVACQHILCWLDVGHGVLARPLAMFAFLVGGIPCLEA